MLDRDMVTYYDRGGERTRLDGTLELLRTKVLLDRPLPAPPASVLDVGGAFGVYATWLAGRGHLVRLVDPVPLHVESSRANGIDADRGDARELAEPDGSWDAVLLLGPLYHLLDRVDRVRALAEARRVVRPGGVVLAATISRWASMYEVLLNNMGEAPGFLDMMRTDLKTRCPARHARSGGRLHLRVLPPPGRAARRGGRRGAATSMTCTPSRASGTGCRTWPADCPIRTTGRSCSSSSRAANGSRRRSAPPPMCWSPPIGETRLRACVGLPAWIATPRWRHSTRSSATSRGRAWVVAGSSGSAR
ncbi:MAG: methyltransferase domain-containing protein [Actinophytocola sp.]|uniref:class I SAM-dependent methyltransferase n=1 Tax=Actinophytocola sp. TaxID=1872138 RepID=UPI001328C437|nr:class I SAM-dependent methyltransferase [Actinophytocola sp.]MPZ84088.1 methyltransferase domain-containing protein [Actinophytocola sp.]